MAVDGTLVALAAAGYLRLERTRPLTSEAQRRLQAVSFALEVASGCGLSPGSRVAAIQPVNARTRRRVGPAQSLLRAGILQAPRLVVARLKPEGAESKLVRQRNLGPQIAALRAEDADDPEARTAAVGAFHAELGGATSCLSSLKWVVIGFALGIAARRACNGFIGEVVVVRR